jgi:hypothetical protein
VVCQGVYVSRIAGTSTVVATDACRAPAPPVPVGEFAMNRTCIVSSAQVTTVLAWNPGQAAPGASEEKLTLPLFACHSVTTPPAATWSSIAFTTPDPSPMVPDTDAGGAAVELCAKPLTSIRFASFDGSSSATSVQVEN